MAKAKPFRLRLMEYESATRDLRDFLGRDDFRVVWNSKTREYEVQQYILGGWDGRPYYLWSTVLTVQRWGPDAMREVHWGLTVPAEVILAEMKRIEDERTRDDARQTADAAYETAKWMWQATPHKKIYSTA